MWRRRMSLVITKYFIQVGTQRPVHQRHAVYGQYEPDSEGWIWLDSQPMKGFVFYSEAVDMFEHEKLGEESAQHLAGGNFRIIRRDSTVVESVLYP